MWLLSGCPANKVIQFLVTAAEFTKHLWIKVRKKSFFPIHSIGVPKEAKMLWRFQFCEYCKDCLTVSVIFYPKTLKVSFLCNKNTKFCKIWCMEVLHKYLSAFSFLVLLWKVLRQELPKHVNEGAFNEKHTGTTWNRVKKKGICGLLE